MVENLTSITGKELIRRILEGERDFARTRLKPETALSEGEGFREMNAHLQKQDLRTTPVIAEGADWRRLRAPGLYFQSARLAGADLSGSDLRGADLRRALFNGTKLQKANLEGAILLHARLVETDLSGANMRGVDMYEAKVNGANLRGVDLSFAYMPRVNFESGDLAGAAVGGVNFYRSDLRNIAGLDSARDVGRAMFHHTVITREQNQIIRRAIDALPRFDVQER